jgi:hypothetical protein
MLAREDRMQEGQAREFLDEPARWFPAMRNCFVNACVSSGPSR